MQGLDSDPPVVRVRLVGACGGGPSRVYRVQQPNSGPDDLSGPEPPQSSMHPGIDQSRVLFGGRAAVQCGAAFQSGYLVSRATQKYRSHEDFSEGFSQRLCTPPPTAVSATPDGQQVVATWGNDVRRSAAHVFYCLDPIRASVAVFSSMRRF